MILGPLVALATGFYYYQRRVVSARLKPNAHGRRRSTGAAPGQPWWNAGCLSARRRANQAATRTSELVRDATPWNLDVADAWRRPAAVAAGRSRPCHPVDTKAKRCASRPSGPTTSQAPSAAPPHLVPVPARCLGVRTGPPGCRRPRGGHTRGPSQARRTAAQPRAAPAPRPPLPARARPLANAARRRRRAGKTALERVVDKPAAHLHVYRVQGIARCAVRDPGEGRLRAGSPWTVQNYRLTVVCQSVHCMCRGRVLSRENGTSACWSRQKGGLQK